jgi:hypothetical protein
MMDHVAIRLILRGTHKVSRGMNLNQIKIKDNQAICLSFAGGV